MLLTLKSSQRRTTMAVKKVDARPQAQTIWKLKNFPQRHSFPRTFTRQAVQVKVRATLQLVKDVELLQMERETLVSSYPTLAARTAAFTDRVLPEQIQEVELKVKGQIPNWLSGTFVRNGPGTYKGMNHMFDGYAMLAKFSFSDGRATYSNRCASVHVSSKRFWHTRFGSRTSTETHEVPSEANMDLFCHKLLKSLDTLECVLSHGHCMK
eukprot:jgi/Botrbrau1/571/Bobra.0010s0037.1